MSKLSARIEALAKQEGGRCHPVAGELGMAKAIETVYKDFRFRSRLEARWAVFFDYMLIDWKYEVEGFTFGDGSCYLPDFYIPALQVFVEIKSHLPTYDETDRAYKLWKSGRPIIVLPGAPWESQTRIWAGFVEGPTEMRLRLFANLISGLESVRWRDLAAIAAKQARFEFGESGTDYARSLSDRTDLYL